MKITRDGGEHTNLPADEQAEQRQLDETKPPPLVNLVEDNGAVLNAIVVGPAIADEGIQTQARELEPATTSSCTTSDFVCGRVLVAYLQLQIVAFLATDVFHRASRVVAVDAQVSSLPPAGLIRYRAHGCLSGGCGCAVYAGSYRCDMQ